jgi:hypothetical protein
MTMLAAHAVTPMCPSCEHLVRSSIQIREHMADLETLLEASEFLTNSNSASCYSGRSRPAARNSRRNLPVRTSTVGTQTTRAGKLRPGKRCWTPGPCSATTNVVNTTAPLALRDR